METHFTKLLTILNITYPMQKVSQREHDNNTFLCLGLYKVTAMALTTY